MNNQRTVILDLRGCILHAFHANMTPEPLRGTLKETINTASYGFTNFLSLYYDLVMDMAGSPLNIIAVQDGGNTYRKNLYPEYKSKRALVEHDPVETEQIELCTKYVKEFLASQGVTLVCLKGQEADDVIAYLVNGLQGSKMVYTMDKDLLALGDKAYIMIKTLPTAALEKTASGGPAQPVPPSCITVYKSLVGDTSDGYPGVKGFGVKAWDSLVEAFGFDGMEELSELLSRNDSKTIKALAKQTQHKALVKAADDYDNWYLMYRIAKLTPELCTKLEANLEWYKRAPIKERLVKVMTDAGCQDLIGRYVQDCYTQTLVTRDNLQECLKTITELLPVTPFVAWDYETHDPVKNPNYIKANEGKDFVSMLDSVIAGCSFAFGRNANHVYYFSVDHCDTNNVPKESVLEMIQYLEAHSVPMVAQNINFEATITKNALGHNIKSWLDTKLFAHHLDENTENGLKYLSKHHLNYSQVAYKDTLASAGARDMSEISGLGVLSYGCDDSLVTAHLFKHFSFLTQLEGTYDFIKEFECPAVELLRDAYITGVTIDTKEMEKQRAKDADTMEVKMAHIRSALQEHCSELNYKGVAMLLEDQTPYITYKTRKALLEKKPLSAQASLSSAIKDALKKYEITLKNNAYYQPLVYAKKTKDFVPTLKGYNDVIKLLGLPELPDLTNDGIDDWLSANPCEFSKVLRINTDRISLYAKDPKKRVGEDYEALRDYCQGILDEHAPLIPQGTELNMGSPNQNQYLLYLLLDLPIRTRTKVDRGSIRHEAGLPGSPATDEAAIQFAIANDCAEHPWKKELLQNLITYKEASTRTSIYWNTYPLWLDDNNLMHPGFNSCGTVTRRPTGGQPNLLQVSKGDVRKIFIPRSDDNVIVSVDFSSEELRVLASVCQDPTFLSAYTGERDLDLHALTACGLVPMFIDKYPDVDGALIQYDSPTMVNYNWFKQHQDDDSALGKFLKACRNMAKTANFGAGYGAGPNTISQQLMIPLEEGATIVEAMASTYPGIATWKDRVYRQARIDGYVATTFGSRRHCGRGLSVGSKQEISRWERQLSNYLIQGQCADLLKVALVELSKNKTLERFGARLIAPIYDELLFEAPKARLSEFLCAVCDDMERPMPGIQVPMVADCSFGPNWGTQIEVGNRPSEETIANALASEVFNTLQQVVVGHTGASA